MSGSLKTMSKPRARRVWQWRERGKEIGTETEVEIAGEGEDE